MTQPNLKWENNAIQFPRLLAEIMATQDKFDVHALAESMDVTVDEINELFDRANDAWEAAKAEFFSQNSTEIAEGEAPSPSSTMQVSLDGGVTYVPAKEGVRVIIPEMFVDGEDEPGELHMNLSEESLIWDVWVSRDEHLDHNIGTRGDLISEMVTLMVADND